MCMIKPQNLVNIQVEWFLSYTGKTWQWANLGLNRVKSFETLVAEATRHYAKYL